MLGRFLTRLRQQRGLTVTAVAALLGRPQPTLSRWENDRNPPSVADLAALLSVLNATDEERLEALRLAAHPTSTGSTRHVPAVVPLAEPALMGAP